MRQPVLAHSRLAQRLEEQLPVVIASEDLFPTIAPCHDVIEGTEILNANAAWHRGVLLGQPILSRIDA